MEFWCLVLDHSPGKWCVRACACLCFKCRNFSHFIFHYVVNNRYTQMHTGNEWFYVTWIFLPLLLVLPMAAVVCVCFGCSLLWKLISLRIESNVPFAFWPERRKSLFKTTKWEKVQYSRLNLAPVVSSCVSVRMCIRLIVFLRRDSYIISFFSGLFLSFFSISFFLDA